MSKCIWEIKGRNFFEIIQTSLNQSLCYFTIKSFCMKIKLLVILCIVLLIGSCSTSGKFSQEKTIQSLKFLSEYTIPYNYQFKSTSVGGLSGIDYDSKNNVYYMISDDRSELNPARFYTAKINMIDNKIDTVIFISTTFLKNKVGKYYPNSAENPNQVPDPEALRFNTRTKNFAWSSEGERIVTTEKSILLNPSITLIDQKGKYLDTFQLPVNFRMNATENGPRRNGVFEGLAFSGDYKTLFVSTEEPLYQDGPRAGLHDSTGVIRIIKYDVISKKPIGQYAYIIDPVAYPPIIKNGFRVNGVSDILWLNQKQLLVVERSYSLGILSNTIKIYIADVGDAENIENELSLKTGKSFKIISKKLLFNMDNLKMVIDNIEGVTFGPLLPNGKKSLIFVSDNNFNQLQRTQLLLFEID